MHAPITTYPVLDEPGIPLVVGGREAEEVVVEAANGTRARLDRQRALHLQLVAVRHQRPGAPAVRADPAEEAGGVVALHRPHQVGNFLVRTEDNDT